MFRIIYVVHFVTLSLYLETNTLFLPDFLQSKNFFYLWKRTFSRTKKNTICSCKKGLRLQKNLFVKNNAEETIFSCKTIFLVHNWKKLGALMRLPRVFLQSCFIRLAFIVTFKAKSRKGTILRGYFQTKNNKMSLYYYTFFISIVVSFRFGVILICIAEHS